MSHDKDDGTTDINQQIEGRGHHIAGRDIVFSAPNDQPKLLALCATDELLTELRHRHGLIHDVPRKIYGSIPARILMVSLPLLLLWMWFTKWAPSEVAFYFFLTAVVAHILILLPIVKTEMEFIERQNSVIREIRILLRERKHY